MKATLPADQHPALLGEEGEGDPQPLDGAVQREKQGPHLVLDSGNMMEIV